MSVPQQHVRVRETSDVAAARAPLPLDERVRWAMTIHDGLTQSVTSAILELQALRHRIATDPTGAIASLEIVEDALRQDLREIREVLFELDEGRLHADPPLGTFLHELVDRWKLPARITIEGDLDDVPERVLEVAHGVVSEALANAAKHSGSKDVAVRVIAGEGELHIEVEDRGRGIAAVTDDDPHFGLRLLQARVHEIGGSIEIESTSGRGVRVSATLPVQGQGDVR